MTGLLIFIGLLLLILLHYVSHIHDHILHIEGHVCPDGEEPHKGYWRRNGNK